MYPAADFCGVIWLARDFNAGAEFAARDAKLWFGTIVDADTVYVNGVEVGSTGYRYPPRKYAVPIGLLREGKNRVVIRVICINGDGGMTHDKPLRVFTDDGAIELAGTWKYRIGVRALSPRPEEFFFQRHPLGLCNAMIAPVLR
jgi:sialate O-acetylesterase